MNDARQLTNIFATSYLDDKTPRSTPESWPVAESWWRLPSKYNMASIEERRGVIDY